MSTRRKRPGRSDPLPDSPVDEEGNPIWAGPSRSQVRREASAVSQLALRLTKLPRTRLGTLGLDDEICEAVVLAERLTKNALARHMRLIAKLLRDLPQERLAELERLTAPDYRPGPAPEERLAERWRTRLLEEGDPALAELLAAFPHAERQRLRQCLRQARTAPGTDRARRASRELLRVIRSALLGSAPEEGAERDGDLDQEETTAPLDESGDGTQAPDEPEPDPSS